MNIQTVVSFLTSLAGPVAAWLHEAGGCCFSNAQASLWVVVGTSGLGVCAGIGWIYAGARLGGIMTVLTNTAVLTLYGFPAVFFLLGGSR